MSGLVLITGCGPTAGKMFDQGVSVGESNDVLLRELPCQGKSGESNDVLLRELPGLAGIGESNDVLLR